MCSGCRTPIFSIMWSRTQSSLTRFYKIGFTGTILFLLAIMWRFEAPTNWMMVGKTSLRLLSPNTIHKKWIVVTSVSSPTEEIEKLSQIREWQLLVVADTKTPKNWTHPNAIMLDIDLQLKLGYHVLQHLPWNAYTRKIIGYLYAIQHGAEFIYDTDDDNAPNNPGTFEKDFVFEPRTRGLILDYNDNNIVTNPYVHFGQPLVWPRGFPHEYIGQSYNNTYTVGPMTTPLIQQGIVNGDPDVDAIYRLTRKKLVGNLNIKFDSRAPPVILPKRVHAPFNSQNTIFHYNAFWAMVLPVSVVFRVTDIWRGYWAQPLLWRIGGHLGFYSTNTTQLRNPHIYLRDFGEEDQLYKQAGHLTRFLSNWQCLSSQDLYNCMLELTSAMVDHKMWSIQEIQLMAAWIQDLKVIGYKVPSLRQQIQGTPWPWLKDKGETFAMFSPVEINSIDPEAEIDQFRGPLRNFCNFTISSHKNHTNETGTATFPSTLLVVTFNYPHYENIWLIDLVYRPHYPNILYCGTLQNVSILYYFLARKEFLSSNVKKFSFVHADVRGGNFAYECAVRAVDMKYNVNGYIVLSDDVLMNFWNNWKFNPEATWMCNNYGVLNTALPINQTGWEHWGGQFGAIAIKNALDQIYNDSNPHVEQFRKNREEYGFNSTIAMVGWSDLFYFPASKQEMLREVGFILRKNEVYLEISVPFLVTGLSTPERFVHLSGIYLWDNLDFPLVSTVSSMGSRLSSQVCFV